MPLNDTKGEHTDNDETEDNGQVMPPADSKKIRTKIRALGRRWKKEVIEPRKTITSGVAKEIAEEAKNCGLSMDYIKMAIDRDEMDDIDREISDANLALAFNAYNKPMNRDLFDAIK